MGKTSAFKYLGNIEKQFVNQVAEIKAFISHWPTVGSGGEQILRQFLRNHLPGKYEIGTGFVNSKENGDSPQIDILIHDSHENAPLYRSGEFVICKPTGFIGAIEVKTKLNKKNLHESLSATKKLIKIKEEDANKKAVIFIFAYDIEAASFRTLDDWLRDYKDVSEGFNLPIGIAVLGKFFLWVDGKSEYQVILANKQKHDTVVMALFLGHLFALLQGISNKTAQKIPYYQLICDYCDLSTIGQELFRTKVGLERDGQDEELLKITEYFEVGDFAKAFQSYQKLYRGGYENSIGFLRTYARLLIVFGNKKKDYEEGLAVCDKGIELSKVKPRTIDYLQQLFEQKRMFLWLLKRFNDAVIMDEEQLRLLPEEKSHQISKQYDLILSGKLDDSILYYEQEMSVREHLMAKINYGFCLYKSFDPKLREKGESVLQELERQNLDLKSMSLVKAIFNKKSESLNALKSFLSGSHWDLIDLSVVKRQTLEEIEYSAFRNDKDFQDLLV